MPTTVVTGYASGIGRAIRQALEDQGHRVIGIDLEGGEIQADLSKPDERQRVIDELHDRCTDGLDGLVCCAGVGVTAPDPGLIVSVNHFAVAALLDGLQDLLARGQNPAALVIGSVAATHVLGKPLPLLDTLLGGDEEAALAQARELDQPSAVYAASKCAVTQQARRLAPAWGKAGIRLNVVAPGAVETPLHQASKEDPRFGKAVREFVAPMGRAGIPEEIASLVAFLQSPMASFIHGAVIHADGGMDAMTRPDAF
ncbi:SDR family oxidoreductase [Halomonas sp. HK25]|uniref:SDR family oxidoreductase n=1 Tax=Halomonas sp. HK25 TaxID=3394321 RepID=UPI0039FC6244